MLDVFEVKTTTGFPYGLLLIKIFEWYGIELAEVAKEFLDKKCLSQLNLKVEKDGSQMLGP